MQQYYWMIMLFCMALLSGIAQKIGPVVGAVVTGALVYYGFPALFLVWIYFR